MSAANVIGRVIGDVIGIDVGGTSTKFGLVASDGSILAQSSIPTCENADPHHFAERLTKALQELALPHGGFKTIRGIGVGAPNANFYSGNIEHAPNLQWKGIVPMAAILTEKLGLKTSITNDANAAAIGEMKFGTAKGMRNFVAVTLGTGLGSGVVVNGELVYGSTGFAGEFGHIIAVRDGRPCNCGRSGCLERYASATGIVTTARELLLKSNQPSVLRDSLETLSSHKLTLAAREGDAIALESFEQTGKVLGRSLADAVVVTSPEAIILTGGLAKAGELLFAPLRIHFERNLLNIFKGSVRLLPSALRESDAAILGAAALVD